jgi:hypothetical protein
VALEHAERKLAAILAADVAGYSRLTGADEEGTMHRLRALRAELIDPAIQTHRGHIFKTMGDGFLVEFSSVVDAVRCFLEVQRRVPARSADFEPDKRIEFRVGVHVGDVMVQPDGDLLGDGARTRLAICYLFRRYLETTRSVGAIARLSTKIQATITAQATPPTPDGNATARRSGTARTTLRERATAKSSQNDQFLMIGDD